jgi:UDPglucose 6-dehydrogenase
VEAVTNVSQLKSLTPNIHHTILTNPLPSFPPPGGSISSALDQSRVVIGHIYSPSSRPEDIDALKKLYTPFIPAERIVTMDAYSAELGQMGQTALLAHQMGAMASLHMLSQGCEANNGAVGWMVGFDIPGASGRGCVMPGSEVVGGLGAPFKEVRSEVKCLVSVAQKLEMQEVAEYWGAVLRMQDFMVRRAAKGLATQLGTEDEKGKKAAIAVLGLEDEKEMGLIIVAELISAGLDVKVCGDGSLKEKIVSEFNKGVQVLENCEAACSGCSGVVVLGSTRAEAEAWQGIGECMKERKVLSIGGELDGVRMKQLGFEVL